VAYGSYTYGEHAYKGVPADPDPPLATTEYFVERPNWAYGVDVTYFMRTAVRQSRKYKETRRPLRRKFHRSERFSVTLKGDDARDFEHFIEDKHAGEFYMPIFTEPIHPSGTGSMATLEHFPVSDNLNTYFNLRELTSYAMLIDLLGAVSTEVAPYTDRVLTGGDTWNIVLGAAITGEFQKESTVVYPCMVAYLSKIKIVDRTDDVLELEMTYKEKA
jgi:hypothetical protein